MKESPQSITPGKVFAACCWTLLPEIVCPQPSADESYRGCAWGLYGRSIRSYFFKPILFPIYYCFKAIQGMEFFIRFRARFGCIAEFIRKNVYDIFNGHRISA